MWTLEIRLGLGWCGVVDWATVVHGVAVRVVLWAHRAAVSGGRMFVDTVTTCADGFDRLMAAADSDEKLVVIDNLMEPTPQWRRQASGVWHVELSVLDEALGRKGFVRTLTVPVDVFGRRPFLCSPRWLWPLIAAVMVPVELVAAAMSKAAVARHLLVVYEKEGT